MRARCVYREAEGKHRAALTLFLKAYGEQHPDTALSYNNVAFCLNSQGKHGEALPLHRRALDIYLKVHGEQHPSTATSYNTAGRLPEQSGQAHRGHAPFSAAPSTST